MAASSDGLVGHYWLPSAMAFSVLSDHAVVVTPIVRRKAEDLGDRGEGWLTNLPDLIADLEPRVVGSR